jgi:hypothetical protein
MQEPFSFGFLKRREFKTYLTPDFWNALYIWRQYCRRGLPSGKGWAEEPESLLDLLDVFDDARDTLDRLKAEQKTMGGKPGHGSANNR